MDKPNKLEQSKTEKTGYGNPPEHTHFKVGESGNPRDRPKGTLNLATVLERTLREKVVINENGRRKTITKLEAAIKQLTNKAASEELKALQLLAALVRSAEERAMKAVAPNSILDEVDEKIFLGILKRLGTTGLGINLLYLLLPCLAPPPFFRRVLVLRTERFYLAAGSPSGAVATYTEY